jgi:protein involved in sex pheromone biosynthesis
LLAAPEKLTSSFVKNMPQPERTIKGNTMGIDYEVIRESSIYHSFAKIKTYDIFVSDVSVRLQVEAVTGEILERIREEDNEIDKITLAFFRDRDIISSNSFDVAYVTWKPVGEITRQIADNDTRDNYEIDILMRNEMNEPR